MAYPRPGGADAPAVEAQQAADARLEHIGAITEAALAHLDLNDLLDELLTRVRAILGADTAAVLLLDEDANELVARAAKGLEEEVEQGARVPVGRGFAGRIAAEVRPIFLPEVTSRNVVNPILLQKGVKSLLGAPLIVEGDVIGVLHVGTLSPHEFSEDDVELLQLAADRIALAVDHARLYEAEREARRTAERQAQELMQLQAITDVALGRLSLDEEVLGAMLERVREVLGVDTAAILLLTAEGDELVARAARGLEEEVERNLRIPIGRGFAGRIASQREPILLEDVDHADVLNPLLREKGIKTLLGAPLIVEDRVIGVLHVGSFEPRSFTAVETGLLERAADRIALAVDRARQHTVADLLQRTLLPPRLPEVPALDLAARYLPAADDTHVGGDWYDVVLLPHGRVGLAIGDVVSRGVRAAAVMGQMRIALRASARDGDGPAPVLDRRDRLVRGLGEREMATVAYLVLDPAASTLTIASAGHLPPLLIEAAGGARLLDPMPSRPIGVAAARRYEEATVEIARGDTLVLYTDGLVERRGVSIEDGLQELASSAAVAPGGSAEEVCDRLVALAEADPTADDIAVLAVRLPPELPERLELDLAAEPGSLAVMRRALQDWLPRVGLDERTAYDVLVAVGEAAANAIEHAYGPSAARFALAAAIESGELAITVRDEGSWRPPRGSHRGRGIAMMRDLMDHVQVDSHEGGTVVSMRRRLERPV